MTARVGKYMGTLVLVLAVVIALQSCGGGDNPAGPTEQAPALPGTSTMKMDLSFFNLAPVNPQDIRGDGTRPALVTTGTGKDNWINAAVRVFYVQLVFYAAFEAPISAFELAINSVPQKQPDGSWLWTYIFVDNGTEYSIFLYGKLVGDHVEWRMEVSCNDPAVGFDHFVWFAGESMSDDSGGFWQFYEPVDTLTSGVPSVRITWSNTANGEHVLTVLNNLVGGPDEGDNLVFYESPNVSYVKFTDVSVPEVHTITWYPDGSGSIEVPDYNNGQMACWDTNQRDTTCVP